MTWACYEWRPSWICLIWRPRREPSLAPAKNQKYITLATSGPNLVLVERIEQFRGKYGLSPLTSALNCFTFAHSCLFSSFCYPLWHLTLRPMIATKVVFNPFYFPIKSLLLGIKWQLNPLTAKFFNLNFYPLEVVSRGRDPQLQVSEN